MPTVLFDFLEGDVLTWDWPPKPNHNTIFNWRFPHESAD